ncbi:MAG: hypothetical protein LBD79_05595 [Treponema sp.]|jgi:hypothetical protein|nr:hypothetical protein [Treponema sp.]
MAQNIISATQIDSSRFEKLAALPVALGSGNINMRVADTLAQILSINLIRSGKYAVYPRTTVLVFVSRHIRERLSVRHAGVRHVVPDNTGVARR